MLLLNILLVPIMAFMALVCVPLVRSPEWAQAVFWRGPLSAGKLVNTKVRREVERALEAYPDADQLILNIARKYADRVLMQ